VTLYVSIYEFKVANTKYFEIKEFESVHEQCSIYSFPIFYFLFYFMVCFVLLGSVFVCSFCGVILPLCA